MLSAQELRERHPRRIVHESPMKEKLVRLDGLLPQASDEFVKEVFSLKLGNIIALLDSFFVSGSAHAALERELATSYQSRVVNELYDAYLQILEITREEGFSNVD